MDPVRVTSLERSTPAERPADRHLLTKIEAFAGATTLSERTDTFVSLVHWTRTGPAAYSDQHRASRWLHGEPDRREAVLSRLEGDANLRQRFQEAAAAMLAESDGTNAIAHAGIPSERGMLAELGERVMNHVLPRPRNDRDLGTLLRRLFHSRRDVERLARMPEAQVARVAALLFPADHPEAAEGLRQSFGNGFRLLATWTQAQGLSPKLRKRSRPCALTLSPFYRLGSASETVAARWLSGDVSADEISEWRDECGRCRDEMAEIDRRLERDGVSTHVVYGLEVIERCLARMEAMLPVMAGSRDGVPVAAVHDLMLTLAISVHHDRSVRHLISWNTHLLQRRIVERSGRTGEHYIATTRAEYRHLWLAAAGGGLLTVGTAAMKTVISGWHGPDFLQGLFYGANYAVSFLVLQHLGLVLATKQPAMTAAALAIIVRERRGVDRANEITAYAARISSSQLAAAVGNVLAVSVGAVTFVFLWQLIFTRPFLADAEASAVFQQLSPVDSGTVFYAALTGVILWLASVIGGWFDNVSAYHRLPLAISQHPAGRYLGRERMARWGDSLSRNAAGWATSVSLGFMLGMTPAIGHFVGLPLDVRHVTLNAGILSLASASLGQRWFGEGLFVRGVAGVAVMFVLNLSVSFLLALLTAARAYDMQHSEFRTLLRRIGGRLLASPREFLLAPRGCSGAIVKG